MNEITKTESAQIVNIDFTPDQKTTIKNSLLQGSTDAELELFCMVCRRSRLDPFQKQITGFISKDDRGNRKLVIATTIDGYRGIAERSGHYEGQTPPMWCDDKGKWVDVWLQDKPPFAAKVGVHRKGAKEPIVGIARFSSFAKYGKGNDGTPYLMRNWKIMGDHMISKVAEAQALRKAFSNDLSGIYTLDEIEDDPNFKDMSKVREYAAEQTVSEKKSKTIDEPAKVPIQNHPKEPEQQHPADEAGPVETAKEKYDTFLSIMEFNEISQAEIMEILKESKLAKNEERLDQLPKHVLAKLVTDKWIERLIQVHEDKKTKPEKESK